MDTKSSCTLAELLTLIGISPTVPELDPTVRRTAVKSKATNPGVRGRQRHLEVICPVDRGLEVICPADRGLGIPRDHPESPGKRDQIGCQIEVSCASKTLKISTETNVVIELNLGNLPDAGPPGTTRDHPGRPGADFKFDVKFPWFHPSDLKCEFEGSICENE